MLPLSFWDGAIIHQNVDVAQATALLRQGDTESRLVVRLSRSSSSLHAPMPHLQCLCILAACELLVIGLRHDWNDEYQIAPFDPARRYSEYEYALALVQALPLAYALGFVRCAIPYNMIPSH